jgi:hypothetical protein
MAAADVDIQIAPNTFCGAGQTGFSGTGTSGDVTVHFWTCAQGFEYCHSKIRKDSGQMMTEVLYENGGPLRAWLAGIEATEGNAIQPNWDFITAVFDAPETDLMPELYQGLRGMGYDDQSAPARCLFLQMQAFERREETSPPPQPNACPGCNDPATGCEGCCGMGCTGGSSCDTSCTYECLFHDLLCGLSTNPACLLIALDAMMSAIQCEMSTPECGGTGLPACNCCYQTAVIHEC